MEIKIEDIFTRCQGLSEYEGERIVDADGSNMFSMVRIASQDKDLIDEYIKQGLNMVANTMNYLIGSRTYSNGVVTIVLENDTSLNTNNLKDAISSTLNAYVMMMWLADKSETRSKAWGAIYDEMIKNTLPNSVKRNKPAL